MTDREGKQRRRLPWREEMNAKPRSGEHTSRLGGELQ
jgi:hypothetical protein